MYEINVTHNINTSPWDIPLTERSRYLREIVDSGRRVTMIIYEFPDTSTFRYRGYNIYQTMKNSQKWGTVYFFRHELDTAAVFLKDVDIVTISRVKWNHQLQLFIDKVKDMGIPVIFDVDDRIYDMDYLPLVTNTLNVDFKTAPEVSYDFWFAQISRIEMTARQADAYIGTNAFLQDTFRKRFGKKGYIIPNFLNDEQVEMSRLCLAQKKEYKKPFVIGYFSGTPSHINDFKLVYKDIMTLLYENDDIFLDVVGFMEFPREMDELIKVGKVRFTNLVDFVKLQELIAGVDVNIVPLVTNDFTDCKSELKFFEAAIVDTITCASPSFTYRNSIKHGETGFLCNQADWYSTIYDIYKKKYDVKKIIDNAHKYAIDRYYGSKVTTIIEEVYDSIMEDSTHVS